MKISPLTKTGIKLASFITLAYFAQGCGGSGGGTPDPDPVEYTFTLSSKLINKCGNETPFTQLELLLQDNNWQIISRYNADDNGQIQFATMDETINYTLVAKTQTGNASEGLDIQSYYQAKASTSVEYEAQYDNLNDQTSCECLTQDVNVGHRSFTSRSKVASSSSYTEWEAMGEGNTIFKDVEICRVAGESWPLHSFFILGTNINDSSIGNAAFSTNFDANSELTWNLSAYDVAEEITLSQSHQAFVTKQMIQNNDHFTLYIGEDDSNLMLFNSHDYSGESYYHSKASNTFQETSSIFGTTVIESNHQLISDDFFASFEVNASTTKPDIDDVNFSEIQADGSYDYSAVSNYPMAVISFNYTVYDNQQSLLPVTWTTYGPIHGQLPINEVFTGYEAFITDETPWNELTVELIRSSSSQNYANYIEQMLTQDNQAFDADLRTYYIEVTK